MTKRERTLALLVGLSLLALLAFFGAKKVTDALRTRRQQIAAQEKQVRRQEPDGALSQNMPTVCSNTSSVPCPADLEKARSLYQTWLLSLVKEAGFQDAQVGVLPAQSEKGVYDSLAFSVSGRGDLRKLVAFLHRFYSADLFHRIRRIVRQTRAGHPAIGSGVFDRRRLAAHAPTARTN